MLTHEDYRIGWICALPLELAAAEAMLDSLHPVLPNRTDDENTYVLGSICQHNIVIACLPDGVYGTTSATAVALRMGTSFPAVRFCLMVGIAGGAPSPQADIRLGDIVVSKPTPRSGGVIQYDYGQAMEGAQFIATGMVNKPPVVLLTAISRLQARHHLHGNNIKMFYLQALEKYNQSRDAFSYPGQHNDLLFKAEYKHVETGQNTCDRCSRAMLQPRTTPRPDTQPHVFYGLIASANQVLRDAAKRDALSREHKMLCFEMEAAGLMDVLPCLVIRGICDYSDSHKNKQWQGYAAITAAAYGKELLSVIPFSEISHTPTLPESVDDSFSCLTRDEILPLNRELQEETLGVHTSAISSRSTWAGLIDQCTLVVGIEFANTSCKVAWATASNFAEHRDKIITTWPGTGREAIDVPAELIYMDGQPVWGYQIPPDLYPICWLSLLLLRDEDLNEIERLCVSENIHRAKQLLGGSHFRRRRNQVGVVADYLRLLWLHTIQIITQYLGESATEIYTFRVVITVPDSWKEYSRKAMEESAKRAGLINYRSAGSTTLNVVSTLEAATLAILCEPECSVNPQDAYVICHAGSRRVALATYEVTSVNPLVTSEIVEETRGSCGSIQITKAFEQMWKARLGLLRLSHLSKANVDEVTKEWEHTLSHSFTQRNLEREYIVPIPVEAFGQADLDDYSPKPYIKKGRIHFKGYHIQQVFSDTFQSIKDLIDDQIKKASSKHHLVKGVILVGSLGSNRYLYEYLHHMYESPRISIIQSVGIKSRTAACRGALYKEFVESVDPKYI